MNQVSLRNWPPRGFSRLPNDRAGSISGSYFFGSDLDSPQQAEQQQQTISASFGKRVLLVESDSSFCESLKTALRQWCGLQISELVQTEEAALQRFTKGLLDIDCILIGLKLPKSASDTTLNPTAALFLVQALRQIYRYEGRIVVLADSDDALPPGLGHDAVLPKQFNGPQDFQDEDEMVQIEGDADCTSFAPGEPLEDILVTPLNNTRYIKSKNHVEPPAAQPKQTRLVDAPFELMFKVAFFPLYLAFFVVRKLIYID